MTDAQPAPTETPAIKTARFTAKEKTNMATFACVQIARLYRRGEGGITSETPGCRWAFVLREELHELVRQQIVLAMERRDLIERQVSRQLHPEVLRLAKAEFNNHGWGREIAKALEGQTTSVREAEG